MEREAGGRGRRWGRREREEVGGGERGRRE
jgi:hypothetical protein